MPVLDLNIIPTYNRKTIAIGDNSSYEVGSTIGSPTLEITVPGFGKSTVSFTTNSLNVYNSNSFNITDGVDTSDLAILPDGVWSIKYTIFPAYDNHFELSFIKLDLLEESFDKAYLSLDLNACDSSILSQGKKDLETIQTYIQGAKSAARVCNMDLAVKLYNMANKKLDKFLKTNCYGLSNCEM